MLYLIRSFTRSGTYLKVGYTGDIERRMRDYLTENPGRELIGTRAGDLTEETRMHLYLTACGFKADFLEEWFQDCPGVLSGFHDRREKMDRLIWRKRETLFTSFDFSRRSLKVQIYEDLRFLHRAENLNALMIDKEWRKWNMKKDLKGWQNILNEEGVMFLR
jgi:hypothetical protein